MTHSENDNPSETPADVDPQVESVSPQIAALPDPFIEFDEEETLMAAATEAAGGSSDVDLLSASDIAVADDDGDSYYAHAFLDDAAEPRESEVADPWNLSDPPLAIVSTQQITAPAFSATPVRLAPAAPRIARVAAPMPRYLPPEPVETPPLIETPSVSSADEDSASEAFIDDQLEIDVESDEQLVAVAAGGGGWTIPFLCAGIGLIACCLIIPLADANRRLSYERQRARADLDHLREQVLVNDEFIRRVNEDPTLAERLAQRQMKQIRAGTKVLDLPQPAGQDVSPFQITAVPLPAEVPPYQPLGGHLASLCYQPRSRLYVMGAGLMLMAVGLVLGYSRQ